MADGRTAWNRKRISLTTDMDQTNQIRTAPLIHSLPSQRPKEVAPSRVVQRQSATLSARFWTKNIMKRPPEASPIRQMYQRPAPRFGVKLMTGPQLEHFVKQLSSATSLAGSLSSLHHSRRIQTVLRAGWTSRPRRDAKSGSLSMKVSRTLFANRYLWGNY